MTYPQDEATYPPVIHREDVPTESTEAEIAEVMRRNHLSGVIHLSTAPTTELLNLEPTSKPSRNAPSDDATDVLRPLGAIIHRGQVPDRWPYLLQKLTGLDDAWGKLTLGALVKIARSSSAEAVSYALAVAELTRPVIEKTAYGWMAATAKTFAEAGVE